jgi:glycosyltransferase involved in cell wall biosynthesis
MRVLHVLAPAAYGGLETVVKALTEGLARLGNEVHVATICSHVGGDFSIPPPVTVHQIRNSGRRYLAERKAVSELMRTLQPQIVHTHGYHADVVHQPGRARPAIFVSTVHGFTGGDLKNRVFEWLQERAYRRFEAVVAVSRPLRNRLIQSGVSRNLVHFIPNATSRSASTPLTRAESRRALGVPQTKKCVGWVGRLSPEKAPDTLLRALVSLPKREDWVVALIGDGPMEGALRELATSLGIESQIVWCGRRPNASTYFQAFDVFAMSSKTEGTPIALLEAVEANIPLVVPAVGGIPDMVGDKEALLFDPEDIGGLSDALEKALWDLEATHARVIAAKARINRDYDTDRWIEAYHTLYYELRTEWALTTTD